MIAIDTSALIAILRREPEADDFLHAILDAERCLLSTVTLLEASIVLAGRHSAAASWQELDLLVSDLRVEIVSQDRAQAELARSAFLRFGKGRHPAALNFGDCSSYALAASRALPLLFKGNDFRKTDLQAVV